MFGSALNRGDDKPLLILGGGGHGRDLADLVRTHQLDRMLIVLDEGIVTIDKLRKYGAIVARSLDEVVKHSSSSPLPYVCGVGFPETKRSFALRVENLSHVPSEPIVHRASEVSGSAAIGAGSVIQAHAFVSPEVQLGKHVYAGYGVLIGHDTVVGSYSSLFPGCFVGGDVVIGDRTMIGANATVLQGVTIGQKCEVGAGAVVTRDVEDGATVVGVPARRVESRGR